MAMDSGHGTDELKLDDRETASSALEAVRQADDGDVSPSTEHSAFEPFVEREFHRITLIRPLTLACPIDELEIIPFHRAFKLGRLERYLEVNASAVPGVTSAWNPGDVNVPNLDSRSGIVECHIRLVAALNDILVAIVTLDFEGNLRDLIAVLNGGYSNSIRYDDQTLEHACATHFLASQECVVSTDRHQLVFLSGEEPDLDMIQRIVYRADLDAVPEFCTFVRPPELNRRPGGGAYLGPYVSVLYHQQDYVENAALLSALLIVIAKVRLRAIKIEARNALNQLNDGRSEEIDLATRRRHAGQLVARMRDLHIQLAFEVEDASTLTDVLPSLRVEAFHRSLWIAAELEEQTEVVSHVLERLTSAVAAELQAIEAVEVRRENWRRLSWSVPVAIISAIAIPATVIFGFFAVGTTDIDRNKSLLDLSLYWPFYVGVVTIVLVSVATGLILRWRGLVLVKRDQRRNE